MDDLTTSLFTSNALTRNANATAKFSVKPNTCPNQFMSLFTVRLVGMVSVYVDVVRNKFKVNGINAFRVFAKMINIIRASREGFDYPRKDESMGWVLIVTKPKTSISANLLGVPVPAGCPIVNGCSDGEFGTESNNVFKVKRGYVNFFGIHSLLPKQKVVVRVT